MNTDMTAEVQPLQIQVVAAFSKNETAISDVTKYMELTVEKHGIGKVTAGRAAVKKLRVAIDHRRKELIETSLETQRTVNAHAKTLTAIVTPVEQYLQDQENAHEAAKLAIEQEKQRARRQQLTDRIEQLAQAGVVAQNIEALEAMTPEEFAQHLLSESSRAAAEREQQEAARIAAEKLEAERIAQVQRLSGELRIRTAELAQTLQALEAQREAVLREQAIDRKRLEAQQAEVARQHAEIGRAEQDCEEAIRKEEQAAAAAARAEALRPEIERADLFFKSLDKWADDYLTTADVTWREAALIHLEKACNEIRKHVERLQS